MSIERCTKHDRTYDSDFCECCPDCERSADWEIDMALAEAKFVPTEIWETKEERVLMLDEVVS